MSVIYLSSLQGGKDCLALIRGRIPVDHVVTIDRATANRARVSGYANFDDLGIPVRHLRRYSMQGPEDVALVKALAPELIIVNGWNRLVPRTILDLPRRGCVGLHGSADPLPAGRGRSPITWALATGATRFFLHLYFLDEGADSGDVIDTARFDLTPFDTCATVHAKVGIVGAGLLVRHFPTILAGIAPRVPQQGASTYLPKWTPQDGRISWTMSLDEVCNLVRAVTRPYDGAFTTIEYRGHPVTMRIWDAAPFSREIAFNGAVGTVVHELDGRPLIKCRDGVMLIKEFTLATGA